MELEIFLSRDCNYTKKYTKTNQVFRFFYVSSCVDVKRHESGDFWKHNLITAPLNMRRTSQETWNRWSSTAPWIDHFFVFTIDMHIIDRDIWLQLACRTGVIFPFFSGEQNQARRDSRSAKRPRRECFVFLARLVLTFTHLKNTRKNNACSAG